MKWLWLGLKISFVFVLVFGVVITVIANWPSDNAGPQPPDIDRARYEITIVNTGWRLYTDVYSTDGIEHTLISFWDMENGKYKYSAGTITINEMDFGPVTVIRR